MCCMDLWFNSSVCIHFMFYGKCLFLFFSMQTWLNLVSVNHEKKKLQGKIPCDIGHVQTEPGYPDWFFLESLNSKETLLKMDCLLIGYKPHLKVVWNLIPNLVSGQSDFIVSFMSLAMQLTMTMSNSDVTHSAVLKLNMCVNQADTLLIMHNFMY